MWSIRFATIKVFVKERPLVAAAIAGVLAMLFAASYLHTREAELLHWGEMLPVVVATRTFQPGDLLTRDALTVERIPRRYVFTDALSSLSVVSGHQVARIAIAQGSQITKGATVPLGTEGGLAAKVGTGERAIALAIDDAHAVGGFLRPGDRVDVLTTFDFGSDVASRLSTLTLMDALPVLAVDRDAIGEFSAASPKKETDETQTVTLLVTPKQAQQLIFAQAAGDITLSLRSRDEPEGGVAIPPTAIRDVTGMEELLRPRRSSFREYRGR